MTAPVQEWNAWDEYDRMESLRLAEQEMWRDPECLVRFWDKFYAEEGVVGDYLELEFSLKRNAAGGLSMVLPGDTVFRDFLLNNPDGVNVTIPVTVDTKGIQWNGKVERISLLQDKDGTETIEVSALHDWHHIASTCLWASPFAPLEAQFPRHHTLFGPTESVVKTYLISNLIRQQLPVWDMTFDWAAAPDWAELGSSMWPIAVVPVDPLRDTSKWCALTARFEMADELFEQVLKDAGLVLTVKLFIPGESEQPAPDWFFLDRPTLVVDVEDKSGVTGPSGTIWDGFTLFAEDLFDDGSLERYPVSYAENDYEQQYYDVGAFGSKKGKPKVIYYKGQYSGIGESEITWHKPLAQDVLLGGRSPGWVNAGIEIAIKNMLAWLGLLIGMPGLDSLYQGQLDDVFLAFGRHRDLTRIQQAGPFAWKEFFVTGSDKAWTLDGFLAGRQGIWDTRGYISHRVEVEDNAPYIFGLHLDIGDMIGFEAEGMIYVDYLTEAVFRDDRQTSCTWKLTVGDGAAEEGPVEKAHRKIAEVVTVLKRSLLDVGADLDLFGIM